MYVCTCVLRVRVYVHVYIKSDVEDMMQAECTSAAQTSSMGVPMGAPICVSIQLGDIFAYPYTRSQNHVCIVTTLKCVHIHSNVCKRLCVRTCILI